MKARGERLDYRPMSPAGALAIWLVLSLLAGIALLFALFLGSTELPIAEAWRALWSGDDSLAATTIFELRMPRALAAFGVGALLALSGCLMQVLLRNPLADPYILGLSGGAAVGALLAMLLGTSLILVNLGASTGALISSLLIFVFAHRELTGVRASVSAPESPRLILTGVMLAAGWGAIVTLILTMAPDRHLRGMMFWMVGDLSGVESPKIVLTALGVAILVMLPLLRQLNVLLHGDAVAATLGVRAGRLRGLIYLIASVSTAVAVTTAGTIGFVGLVVPHALRIVIGNDQRVLVPAAALAGGGLLVIADTIARVIFDPLQLPVGAVMVCIGVPAFLYLLRRLDR